MDKLNSALVQAVQNHVPNNANSASVVADTLHMGREAAYRRLRGEVLFTFGEAALLSSRLGFSLDETTGSSDTGNVLFRLKFVDFNSTIERYNEMIECDIRHLRELAADPLSIMASATNMLPAELYMKYDSLSTFKLFKWLYQHGLLDPDVHTFEQMHCPESLFSHYREYVAAAQMVATSCYIFDDGGFLHWINALNAFRSMHLISPESIARIREELQMLLEDVEQLAVAGEYPNGNSVFLYLSEVDLDAVYYYMQSRNCKAASIGLFSLNAVRTTDESLFEYVKRWVTTQSRFSTLISRSGEMQRIHYFKRQREILSRLD